MIRRGYFYLKCTNERGGFELSLARNLLERVWKLLFGRCTSQLVEICAKGRAHSGLCNLNLTNLVYFVSIILSEFMQWVLVYVDFLNGSECQKAHY